jgi:hypothetical protein
VPDALVEWRNAGIKTYIYSSGSREAQVSPCKQLPVAAVEQLCVVAIIGGSCLGFKGSPTYRLQGGPFRMTACLYVEELMHTRSPRTLLQGHVVCVMRLVSCPALPRLACTLAV